SRWTRSVQFACPDTWLDQPITAPPAASLSMSTATAFCGVEQTATPLAAHFIVPDGVTPWARTKVLGSLRSAQATTAPPPPSEAIFASLGQPARLAIETPSSAH